MTSSIHSSGWKEIPKGYNVRLNTGKIHTKLV